MGSDEAMWLVESRAVFPGPWGDSGLRLGGQAPPGACAALPLLGWETGKCCLLNTGHSKPHGLNTLKDV